VSESLADQAVRRRAGARGAAVAEEVRRLLDAGLDLMIRSGRAPTVAEIVRAAGVTNDAFYRAFAGKDELVAAIVDDGARRLLAHAGRRRDGARDPRQQVRRVVDAVLRQAVDPTIATQTRAVLAGVALTGPVRAVGQMQLAAGVAELLHAPFEQLGRRDPRRDALAVAHAVVGLMEHFLWSVQPPTKADVDHIHAFALGQR
jgi:AcrR family transcriptional regulator